MLSRQLVMPSPFASISRRVVTQARRAVHSHPSRICGVHAQRRGAWLPASVASAPPRPCTSASSSAVSSTSRARGFSTSTSSPTETTIYQVDAFASSVFKGNPSSVAVLPAGLEVTREWMGHVAAELNISETAFIQRLDDESAKANSEVWSIRWIEPNSQEISLCAHAALASAHVLWENNFVKSDSTISFKTLSYGIISGHQSTRDGKSVVEMAFPVDMILPLFNHETGTVEKIYDALGIYEEDVVFVGKNTLDYAIEVKTPEQVSQLSPSMPALRQAIEHRGVVITAKASEEDPHDFVSRFFAPTVNRPEDPVTGATHLGLAPYWTKKLYPDYKTSDTTTKAPDASTAPWVTGFQASNRGGTVYAQWHGNSVTLAGEVSTVLRCTLADEAQPHAAPPEAPAKKRPF